MTDKASGVWIFAYGSLIFCPSFPFLERRRAFVAGWARRFWQGSPDHRGEPHAPGRVVTLVPIEGATCGGCAYRVDPAEVDGVLAALDMREQAGFERRRLRLFADPAGADPFAEGVTWIADASNAHFLGPLSEPEIAEVIRVRKGPSGPNVEYAIRLRGALRELDVLDAHVEEIARHLERV